MSVFSWDGMGPAEVSNFISNLRGLSAAVRMHQAENGPLSRDVNLVPVIRVWLDRPETVSSDRYACYVTESMTWVGGVFEPNVPEKQKSLLQRTYRMKLCGSAGLDVLPRSNDIADYYKMGDPVIWMRVCPLSVSTYAQSAL